MRFLLLYLPLFCSLTFYCLLSNIHMNTCHTVLKVSMKEDEDASYDWIRSYACLLFAESHFWPLTMETPLCVQSFTAYIFPNCHLPIVPTAIQDCLLYTKSKWKLHACQKSCYGLASIPGLKWWLLMFALMTNADVVCHSIWMSSGLLEYSIHSLVHLSRISLLLGLCLGLDWGGLWRYSNLTGIGYLVIMLAVWLETPSYLSFRSLG